MNYKNNYYKYVSKIKFLLVNVIFTFFTFLQDSANKGSKGFFFGFFNYTPLVLNDSICYNITYRAYLKTIITRNIIYQTDVVKLLLAVFFFSTFVLLLENSSKLILSIYKLFCFNFLVFVFSEP